MLRITSNPPGRRGPPTPAKGGKRASAPRPKKQRKSAQAAKSKGIEASKPSVVKENAAANPAMELALRKAGAVVDQLVKHPDPVMPTSPERKRIVLKKKIVVEIAPAPPKATIKPKKPKSPKVAQKPVAPVPLKTKKKKKAKVKRSENAAPRTVLQPPIQRADQRELDERWRQRRDEIGAFLDRIERCSFGELLTEWRRYVGLADISNRVERRKLYKTLLAGIEAEWARRGKLSHASSEYFDWPSTKAGHGRGGDIGHVDWVKLGVLRYLGYHVGETSDLTAPGREALLCRVFTMNLPPIESPDYMASWGKPANEARLKKMADSLASFTRSDKRRTSADMSTAIAERESDLRMLYNEFYVKKFGFGWPSI